MLLRCVFLLIAVVLGGCEATPAINCNLTMVAQVPLEVEDHLLVVRAGINGKWVRLVVDTGAERTTISDAAATRLGLPDDPKYSSRSLGIGGSTTAPDVTVERFVLGDAYLAQVRRIAVSSFNLQTPHGLNADGLLGGDILLAFDMDIDVPNGKLTLYLRRVCPNPRPPWPEHAVEITGVRAIKDRMLLPIDLDGVSGMAVLDTGAQGDLVGMDMARRMGLNDQTMAPDPSVRQRGVGPAETISHLHQFSLLRIGPIVEESPKLAVLTSDFGVSDALIGEVFLQGRRVWLSFGNRQVFVSKRPNERQPDEP
jgi:hypothetical protein